MSSLISFALHEEYKRLAHLGDRLHEIDQIIDWKKFRPIVNDLYKNTGPQGGRPNIDEIVMVKLMFLGEWNSLSDPELERQCTDRISFRHFLGFPKKIPDHGTIWLFRERLIQTGRCEAIWEELQRQLDENGLAVKKGTIQDATFVIADSGHATADKPRGDEAKTRRSKDGTWAKKGNKSYFGYKTHIKTDLGFGLIRDIETTPANVHDSQVDLLNEGEIGYKDKGYFGVSSCGYDATMKRATRGHPLTIRDKLRNKRISRKRAPGERPFAVMKTVFRGGHVRVTTVKRVYVKQMFAAFAFNLYQLVTLKKRGMWTPR